MHVLVSRIAVGIALQLIAIWARVHLRRCVIQSGVRLRSWVVIEDELWVIQHYLDIAKGNHKRYWLLLAISGLPIGILIMVSGIVTL